MYDTILTIATLLLTGTNIFQFIFIRQERRKADAAAEEAATDARRKKYELTRDQADYLIGNLDRVQKEYMDLQQQVRDQATKYTETILDKCATIADLKAQVVYEKQFKCYRADCSHRISKKPNEGKEEEA